MFSTTEPVHIGNWKPMIITVALTGAVPSKSRYPSLPISTQEIIEQACLSAEAGASTVHIHLRDSEGRQTQNVEQLESVISGIRTEQPDLIICATTTSRGSGGLDERMTPFKLPLGLLPDMASLTLGSYNTPTGVNANPQDEILALASRMRELGVSPEVEIFEPGMAAYLQSLLKAELLETPAIVNILLGVEGASPARADSLVGILNMLPVGLEWAVAGIGRYQRPMVALGASMGGNVRVGMEDDPRGEGESWDNVKSVKRAVLIAENVGREIETPLGARVRLALPYSA